MDKTEVACVKFSGNNYFTWEFQFHIYVQGKDLWRHIDGTNTKPTDSIKVAEWEAHDARVKSWLVQTMEPAIAVNLRPYKTAKGMWDYLKKVYDQKNSARRFQLEYDISNYTQGNLSFESIRANLLQRSPSPSLDICLNELLREEQRQLTQATLGQHRSSNAFNVAYAAQGKQRVRNMSNTQCYSCKAFGHIANQCPQKFCNYCKVKGHIITECRKRPQNRNSHAFHTSTISDVTDCPTVAVAFDFAQPSASFITQENVQQMILSAPSALGITGKNKSLSKPWLFDSAASNHVTPSFDDLINIKKYDGNLQIETANGDHLPIAAIGDISSFPSMKHVFVSPHLSANLLSVGQMVENNCKVVFKRIVNEKV
ncbi:hypothetical protein K2173_019100 [Erythroxylum novogranatense]|uniref:CCHC-type domain-containing protein n=1 Tax=Erythroxylum novogranatense TaxID=1862640 RepID=A0AAV8SSM0_9ROSI|nr:hypothetical protein K2173_019100 [Erythroxylum novogranatense]